MSFNLVVFRESYVTSLTQILGYDSVSGLIKHLHFLEFWIIIFYIW